MNPRALVAIIVITVGACGGKATPAATTPGGASASTPASASGGDATATPSCTADDVVGSWTADTGADFESITIEADGTFSSYLHDRPFDGGNWLLQDGTLSLMNDGTASVDIADARCQDGVLTGTSDGAPVHWTALAPEGI